jgi:hypothetical protein
MGKECNMQPTKLTAFLAALALGAAVSAGAQTVVIQATPDTPPPPSGGDTLLVIPPTATPVPDPAADAKCRGLIAGDYWECMNSHNAGQ